MRHPALVVVVVVLAGCTQTRTLAPDDPHRWDEVNGRGGRGEGAVVTLASGEAVRARAVHVAPDVATWLDPETGDGRSAPTGDVVSVTFSDPGRGALQGLAIGGTLGALLGMSAGTFVDFVDDFGGPGDATVVGMLVGGAVAGGLGALAGRARGGRTAFLHPAPPPGPPDRR